MKLKAKRCLMGVAVVAAGWLASGCESVMDGIVQGQIDQANHDAYKQYYQHAGYDNKTADRKADADVLWDNMSQQH